MEINRYLDHAVLKPELTQQEVTKAIQVGIDYQVKTVCVKPCDIELAVKMCKGSKTKVCCVLDFPYGYGEKEAKAQMAKRYVDLGAQEVDMVMNF